MALSANTVVALFSGGSDNNGGGFVTGASGTDWSQQNSAQYNLTGIATAGAGATFLYSGAASDMVGNIFQVISGTNFTLGFFQVLSVVVGVSVTADRNVCTGVGASGVINIGGALASPGMVSKFFFDTGVSGQICYAKGGVNYIQTSTTANVSGGKVSLKSGLSLQFIGYTSTRSDGGQVTIDAGALTSYSMFVCDGTFALEQLAQNVTLDGKGNSTVVGFDNVDYSLNYNCYANNCTTGFNFSALANATTVIRCKADTCTTGFSSCTANFVHDSWANACTVGFLAANGGGATHCIATGGTTGFKSGFLGMWSHCTGKGQSGAAFLTNSSSHNFTYNACLAVNAGTYSFNTVAGDQLIACAGYGAGTANINATPIINFNFVALTVDPCVNTASNDLRPNNTVGGGAAIRGTGTQVLGQTDNQDVGAVQHSDSSGVIIVEED